MIRWLVLVMAAATLTPTIACAQAAGAAAPTLAGLQGDYFKLDSVEVGRPFHIHVRYPEGYDPAAAARYPVVYLLDGDLLFPILASQHLLLSYDDKLPEAIIVGIAYGGFGPEANKRGYDYSIPAPDALPDQGGAAKFHGFIKRELIPAVEAKYRADPLRRILVGQSRGGHFVLYSAMIDPELFWARIASNPAFRPAEEFLRSGTPGKAARTDLKLLLFSGSNDRADLRTSALAWDKAWAARRDAPWQRWFLDMPGATHAANIPDAYRSGLRWFFGYSSPGK
jgi:uncharacterized protein